MMTIDDYKDWYNEHYGKKPSEKLIESFCKSNGFPWPPPPKVVIETKPEPPLLTDQERKDAALYIARTHLEEIAQFEGDIKGADEIARQGLDAMDAALGGNLICRR